MSVPPQTAASRQQKVRIAILVGGFVIALAFAYGSGMRGQKKALETVKQDRRVLLERLRLTELKLQGRDALLQQLEARRQIALALLALDQRNFGIVRERLDAAAERLETADRVGAASAAALGGGADLRGVKVEVGPDLEALRARLLALAQRMDAELTKVAPPPTEISPVTIPVPNLNDTPRLPGPEIGR